MSKASKDKAVLSVPSVLAFQRTLEVSDAFFSQSNSQSDKPAIDVKVVEKSVRGTISNRLKSTIANDPEKVDKEIEKANLQRVDSASLDENCDTLQVSWSCRILPFNGVPCLCNEQDYQKQLTSVVSDYIQEHGFSELAKRYATNIANARWLWRNRLGAKNILVSVTYSTETEQKTLEFNAKDFSIRHFDHKDKTLNELAKIIEKGLAGEEFVILYINSKVVVGYGQTVYPSEELVLDKFNVVKSKELYQIGGKAGFHSQKIGNSLRTIDNWYSEEAEYPIAVETYGAVTTKGIAFRQPKEKLDFYNLFDNWVLKGDKPDVEQQHYVVAVLIRGGVFGESSKGK